MKSTPSRSTRIESLLRVPRDTRRLVWVTSANAYLGGARQLLFSYTMCGRGFGPHRVSWCVNSRSSTAGVVNDKFGGKQRQRHRGNAGDLFGNSVPTVEREWGIMASISIPEWGPADVVTPVPERASATEVATAHALVLDTAMIAIYDEAMARFEANIRANCPIILALFSDAGGDYTLYRPGEEPLVAPPSTGRLPGREIGRSQLDGRSRAGCLPRRSGERSLAGPNGDLPRAAAAGPRCGG